MFPTGLPAKPNYLYTSGKEGRYNYLGTICLYLSVEEATAMAEFRRQFRGLGTPAYQPTCNYFAEARLRRVLDLLDPATLKHLSISPRQLEADWGFGLASSLSQDLGESARGHRIEAILYGSIAAQEEGVAGTNLVIFREALEAPSRLTVLGPAAEPLDRWP